MRYPAIASKPPPDCRIAIGRRNAYHQAGHAAAIYLGNKQKKLPVVFFQIVITPHEQSSQPEHRFASRYCKYHVKVEGGRLIHRLPSTYTGTKNGFFPFQKARDRCAFEADVINLLAGSLAEAKYVAERDDEVFNDRLVNIEALHFYGGSSDLSVISDYLTCFLPDKNKRDQKLNELFLAAFSFINQRSNWNAIISLADYILAAPNRLISCEEAMTLLEFHLAA